MRAYVPMYVHLQVDKHWTEKKLEDMTERDWRIFREDFNIAYKGSNTVLPLRNWDETNLPEKIRKVRVRAPAAGMGLGRGGGEVQGGEERHVAVLRLARSMVLLRLDCTGTCRSCPQMTMPPCRCCAALRLRTGQGKEEGTCPPTCLGGDAQKT